MMLGYRKILGSLVACLGADCRLRMDRLREGLIKEDAARYGRMVWTLWIQTQIRKDTDVLRTNYI